MTQFNTKNGAESIDLQMLDGLTRISNQLIDYKSKSNFMPQIIIGTLLGYELEAVFDADRKFEESFIENSKLILDFQRFKAITDGKVNIKDYENTSKEYIKEYYNALVMEYINRFEFFTINFMRYLKVVDENQQLLTSKKRNLLLEDEFGKVDSEPWIDYLQRFAEKFELVNTYNSITNEIESVTEYLKLMDLDKFQGRALWYMLAIYDQANKKDDEFSNVYTGVDFELHLKESIEQYLSDVYVETTPSSGDHGADLIVRYKGVFIAIQAKYYTGSVGNAAVQEIHSGMRFYDADYGMVVTQSKYTEHAKSLADKLGIYLESTESYISRIEELAGG